MEKKIKIPKKLIERIMKEFGAKRISNDAKEKVSEDILKRLESITVLSIRNSRHLGRKLIKKEDVEFAIKNI